MTKRRFPYTLQNSAFSSRQSPPGGRLSQDPMAEGGCAGGRAHKDVGSVSRFAGVAVGDLRHGIVRAAPAQDRHGAAAAATGDLGSVEAALRSGFADELDEPVG